MQNDRIKIEVILDAGATIGEAPTWSAHEQALYSIDIKKPALFRYDIVTQAQQCWPVSSDIGGFALVRNQPGAVVALRYGLFLLDFGSGALTLIADPPFDPALFRFNEAACDPSGRLWIGVMFDPFDKQATPRQSQLHSFTFKDGLRVEPDAAELHNGMAWSPDASRFFLSHSNSGIIYSYACEDSTGRLGPREIFAQICKVDGIPDGAAVDDEGGYWCALHGGGRLRRYDASGRHDRDIALPVSQPTMCAFAGPELEDLYVTSASDKLTDEQKRDEPFAGALLRLRPGERGIHRYNLVK